MFILQNIGTYVIFLLVNNGFSTLLKMPVFEARRNETFDLDDTYECRGLENIVCCSVQRESTWMENMKSHFSHVQFYLNILKRKYEDLSNVTSEIVGKEEYLGDPISLFSLLKRTAKDWASVVGVMHSLSGPVKSSPRISSLFEQHMWYLGLPNIGNLETGYRALSRLQLVYHLPTTFLADQPSSLYGDDSSLFSARESFDIAMFYYIQTATGRSQEWLQEMLEKRNYQTEVPEEDVLELHFITKCLNGDEAISTILKRLVESNHSFTPSTVVLPDLDSIIKHGCEKLKAGKEQLLKEKTKTLNCRDGNSKDSRFIPWKDIDLEDPSVLELCNYPAVYVETARLLRCRYVHYNKPQMMLGPFKMEEFHLDPPVLMFHDVISDKEIAEMAEYGKPYMMKAPVLLDDSTDAVHSYSRTNEQAWIEDWEHPVSEILSRRAAMFTGWDLHLSETNQLAGYSPAGEFFPHVDALSEEDVKLDPLYADYSVVMFYTSDVTAGGHTIFPYLNVSLVPQKGSAAVWFNRKPDGSPDRESLHGGCPVLRGYKWVVNKWFHKTGQDFPKCIRDDVTSFRYFYL